MKRVFSFYPASGTICVFSRPIGALANFTPRRLRGKSAGFDDAVQGSGGSQRSPEQHHLAGMIQVVLSHADELIICGVSDLWDERLVEPFWRERTHRLTELLVQPAQFLHGLLPVLGCRRWT